MVFVVGNGMPRSYGHQDGLPPQATRAQPAVADPARERGALALALRQAREHPTRRNRAAGPAT
jgi:hypothetical protein